MGPPAADSLTSRLAELAAQLAGDCGRLGDVFFNAPERAWFGVPVLAVLILVPLARRVRAGRAIGPLAVRALILAALLGVLLEPAVEETHKTTGRVLVLADVSPSVGETGVAATRAYLAGADMPFDLVAFGATPTFVGEGLRAAPLAPDPRGATDLAAALRIAAARAARPEPLRVLLLSDGRATTPGSEGAALRLRRAGAEVAAVAVPATPPARATEVAVLGLDLPPRDERREPFTLTARVEAADAVRVQATLYIDGAARRAETVALEAGAGRIPFKELALPAGRHYAQVLVAPDPTPADSVAGIEFDVPGVPRVLCIARTKRRSLIADALRTQGIEVAVAAADAVPTLKGFDAVVWLPDAPREQLAEQTSMYSEFVTRRGGGLLAVGGTDGPGLARLYGTPLSYLLPLDVKPRPPAPKPTPPEPKPQKKPRIEIKKEKKQAYPITLIMVLDTSGSMLGYKLRQVQRSALLTATALTPEDRFAVITFGTEARLAVAPRTARVTPQLRNLLAGLRADGLTAMYPALALAAQVAREDDNPIRHIVVLADGKPNKDNGPWKDLVTKLRGEKITVSTVAVGLDIDPLLMSSLARWGAGTYWHARADQIAQVITQDTLSIMKVRDERGRDAERARPPEDEAEPEPEPEPEPKEKPQPPPPPPPAPLPIVPEAAAPREMLRGIPDKTLPRVAEVESGTPRFAAWVAARAGADGPPLATYGRMGLGTTAALTIDPEADANRELRGHPEFPRLVAQLVRSILPDAAAAAYTLRHGVLAAGGEERLTLRLVGEDGLPRTDLAIDVRVGGERRPVTRRADRYETLLPPARAERRVDVRVGPAAAPVLERVFFVPASEDAELARTGADRAALRRLIGDGAMDPAAAVALTPPERSFTKVRPLWLPFLAFAAILLPFDAWARRRARSVWR